MKFVAHAPTRAASTLMSMPVELSTSVEMSRHAPVGAQRMMKTVLLSR
jgi:hypothetical protein